MRTTKAAILLCALALAGCNAPGTGLTGSTRSLTKADRALVRVPDAVYASMSERRVARDAPILMRVFKKESELEVWRQAAGGRYVLVKTYPICRWSGQLGPKRRKGDRQAPEGFYSVSSSQMNPNSAYFLSFDLGYPNAVDRANGGTGSALMVHGSCTSAGCFAMTDEGVGEIYAMVREAMAGGQSAFQVQSYPFRMTAANMALYRADPNFAFWANLKQGSDRFEATGRELGVVASGRRYAFHMGDAEGERAVEAHRAAEDRRFAEALARGVRPIRTHYADGGMHRSFAGALGNRPGFALMSRPDALAYAGRDVEVAPDMGFASLR